MQQALSNFLNALNTHVLVPIMTLLALAAFAYFIYGVVMYIRDAGDPEKRKTGNKHLLWGIIGLVIIFGANAIIAILRSMIGLG
jgi:succinate dehydrogenase/fumarate reductase cytochrome b subunit